MYYTIQVDCTLMGVLYLQILQTLDNHLIFAMLGALDWMSHSIVGQVGGSSRHVKEFVI